MEGDLVEEKLSNKRGRDEEKGVVGRLEKRASGVVVLEDYNGDEMINGVKYEEEKETTSPSPRLFNQLITNLVNTPTPKPNEHQPEAESEKISEEKGTPNVDDNGNTNGDGAELAKPESEKDGNIIDNIVARLPRTLSEDRAPATDEASILIHSIIHD